MYSSERESGMMSLPQFIIVGVVLVVVLFGSVYGVKQFASTRSSSTTATTSTPDKKQPTEAQTKKAAEEKKDALEQKKAEEKKRADAEAAKKAEQAAIEKKAAEEKKRQEAVTQQQASAPQATTQTPEAVASTGPEDTLFAVVGIGVFSYALYGFIQSRKMLSHKRSRVL